MLSLIIDKHGFSSNIRDLTSCYYTKNNDLEDSFCAPFTVSTDGPWIGMMPRPTVSPAFANTHPEILYTIRYPEYKEGENEWSIRQTGICHRINTETRQSVVLLLGPKPNSSSHATLYSFFTTAGNQYTGTTWFALHDALLKAHLPAWRSFNKACEAEFLPIVSVPC